ncbi:MULTISPECIES: DUF3500 domain-containing protein [unclassified Streptomyces]|uniref:DUF3500 domain-containing protein n=1 Tax=unclassified Streptomyces TaxID=2593676 RepID=UPI002366D324|nr:MULTISPECIES: DUF3500 domain-containing protein [unclassified Streptomyces]MDF3141301.1 DUF3500 domain-containing protein [Streptomyces sp. T21Q-yed]WDF43277.1 DUF3500 domain-containing protein [Streptomyces sp. T12]
MSKQRTSRARNRRTWRVIAGVAAGAVLVGGGFVAANAATTTGDAQKSATGVHYPVNKKANGVAAVVSAANTFLNTLDSDQQAETLLDFSQENATAWSNLPCGGSCRPGIQTGSLSEVQLAALKNVLKVALGTGKDTGYEHVLQTLLADDQLAAAESSGSGPAAPTASASSDASADPSTTPSDAPTGAPPSGGTGGGAGGGYGSDIYFLAFLGTPSVDGTWQLHFGGHHLAVNITYKDGKVSGASPFFTGVEPTSWTADDGTTYAPLANFRDGLLKLTSSLSTEQLATAKLSESFSDVLLGPGEDGQFPETKEGIRASELSPKQQKLVLAAIHPWVAGVDDATAKKLMKTYARELNQTYVGYSGGTGLDTQGDYVRIDGPSVWIEFVCQNGFVYRDKVHYHTVYRDHTRDYGSEFSFS